MKTLDLIIPTKKKANIIDLGEVYEHDTVLAFAADGMLLGPVTMNASGSFTIRKGMSINPIKIVYQSNDYASFFETNQEIHGYTFKVIKS